ncbi:MAG: hypothetical protein AB1454_12370 [Candidatus Auribacterota bacterium]
MKRWYCMMVALVLCVVFCAGTQAQSDVPKMLNFQGRVSVDGQPFTGTNGQFKFALVSEDGLTTFWSNDNTSVNGGEPTSGVAVDVRDGIYSVVLGGDGMAPIPDTVFAAHGNVWLRIWFNDGTHGFERLDPDQRILSVGYALRAAVADNVESSSREVISGMIDTRDSGDEYYDVVGHTVRDSVYQNGYYQQIEYPVYSRIAVQNIPVAGLSVDDLPITQIYFANDPNASEWYTSINELIYKEAGLGYGVLWRDYIEYTSFRVANNMIKLSYPHLLDRSNSDSTPYISYVSGSPSYNVYYKIVIIK